MEQFVVPLMCELGCELLATGFALRRGGEHHASWALALSFHLHRAQRVREPTHI